MSFELAQKNGTIIKFSSRCTWDLRPKFWPEVVDLINYAKGAPRNMYYKQTLFWQLFYPHGLQALESNVHPWNIRDM